jgi:site-specific recombinase XerD
MLGWFRWLCELRPPIGNHTREQRLLCLRRLLDDVAAQGHPIQPGLIIREDFPVRPEYLPRALSPEDDRRLQAELSRADNVYSNALLLMRVTGIRVGECIHLAELRAQFSTRRLAKSAGFLLPRVGRRFALFQMLRLALADFAKRAGCTDTIPITPHRLRHTWASDMLRCGIGLPALKELMGHKDIRMTLRYLKITQPDLQREVYRARHNAPQSYCIPSLSVSGSTSDLLGIRHALAATRHLLEMYRRQLSDDKASRRLQRLDRRLLDVDQALQDIATAQK